MREIEGSSHQDMNDSIEANLIAQFLGGALLLLLGLTGYHVSCYLKCMGTTVQDSTQGDLSCVCVETISSAVEPGTTPVRTEQ